MQVYDNTSEISPTKRKGPLRSIAEACEYLGVGRTTLYWLVARNELQIAKLGRRSFIKLADLDAFIERLPAYERPGQQQWPPGSAAR